MEDTDTHCCNFSNLASKKLNPKRGFLLSMLNSNFFRFSYLILFLFHQVVSVSARGGGDGMIVTQSDFQALRAIKHDLIDPLGFLRSWNDSGYGVCSGGWTGIKCANGQVIAIQLPWRGLGGRISEKIGQLQGLRKLSLHDNVLTGPVPHSLGFLPTLRGIYLFNNRISGSIPPEIGNCHVLQSLDFSNNSLSGSIPSTLANSSRLFRVNFSFNSLSGSIPISLTKSPSLTILDLRHNNLSGPIPDSWGHRTRNSSYQLQFLTLDYNLLTGTIPVSLTKLRFLEQVSLSHNRISGPIPNELGHLSNLQMLDLSYNGINGSFPDSFPNLSSLVSLNLEGNHLSGQIPATVDRLQNLTVFDLSGNGFTGEIPHSLTKMSKIGFFNVSYNNLSGPVPLVLAKKFNSSSFVGNIQLCGYSPSTICPSAPPSLPPSESQGITHHRLPRKLSLKDIILIAVGILLLVMLIFCCILICCLVKRKRDSKEGGGKAGARGNIEKSVAATAGAEAGAGGENGGKLVLFDGPLVFTADDLLCATAEIMGKSTYGTAYKAIFEDGNQVAVKRLREKTTKQQREFETEAATLGKIRHPNLLSLRAYYIGAKGEKLLVFDFMPRGSLASFLHAQGPETTIDWPTRMRIALGITRGLDYLHTKENMIHGNLTSSNILLDDQINAHISDFGLSKLMTAAASTNMIATAGALGYRAPEFSKLKNGNTKTDVYSLGVIILELLTGKAPGEPTNGMELPQWVASIVKEEWTNEVFDLELVKDTQSNGDEMLNTLKLALQCVDPSPAARPEVQQVLKQLEEIKPEIAAAVEGSKSPPTNQ